MDSSDWDARYEASELVWTSTPNIWVEQIAGDLPPGRVIDLAAGEGRNTLWLAERGWKACAIDFSQVAIDRAREMTAALGHELGEFHPFAASGSLLVAHCTKCARPVWAGRREVFGVPTECRCEVREF